MDIYGTEKTLREYMDNIDELDDDVKHNFLPKFLGKYDFTSNEIDSICQKTEEELEMVGNFSRKKEREEKIDEFEQKNEKTIEETDNLQLDYEDKKHIANGIKSRAEDIINDEKGHASFDNMENYLQETIEIATPMIKDTIISKIMRGQNIDSNAGTIIKDMRREAEKTLEDYQDELNDHAKHAKQDLEEFDITSANSIESNRKGVNEIIQETGLDFDSVLDNYEKGVYKIYSSTRKGLEDMEMVTVRPTSFSSEIGKLTEPGVFISKKVLDEALENRENGEEPFDDSRIRLMKGHCDFRIVTPEEKELLESVEKGIDNSKSSRSVEKDGGYKGHFRNEPEPGPYL